MKRNDTRELTKRAALTEDELEQISGADQGTEADFYCVSGFSKTYHQCVELFVSTYEDAVTLCKKLGLNIDCIKARKRH